ncbi:MAG: flavodoxin family protein [Pseudomonadota bacterium]
MPKIEIVAFSGYGHTARQAEAVLTGARAHGDGRLWMVPDDGQIEEAAWDALDAADAIVLGSPTYMGGPAWQLKRFIDASSAKWQQQMWKDKLMGGFTNCSSPVGDKGAVLGYFATLAAQHGALWVPLGQPPAAAKANGPDDTNRLGGSLGPVAQSPHDAAPEEMHAGDLESARIYGARIAQLAAGMAGVDDGAQLAAE